ncbi:MAG: hypothetical protein WD276_10765 [Actinomycetota bacterium]
MRSRVPLVLVTAALVLGAACSQVPAPSPEPSPVPPAPETESPSSSVSPKPSDNDGTGTGGGIPQADLKVFGYATADQAQLARDLASVGLNLERLISHITGQNLTGGENDSKHLRNDARRLENNAKQAVNRMEPLAPTDGRLRRAKGHALRAFKLSSQYAVTAQSIGDAGSVMTSDGEARSVSQRALQLIGTGTRIQQAYAAMNRELTDWSEKNPTEASLAVQRYGH